MLDSAAFLYLFSFSRLLNEAKLRSSSITRRRFPNSFSTFLSCFSVAGFFDECLTLYIKINVLQTQVGSFNSSQETFMKKRFSLHFKRIELKTLLCSCFAGKNTSHRVCINFFCLTTFCRSMNTMKRWNKISD